MQLSETGIKAFIWMSPWFLLYESLLGQLKSGCRSKFSVFTLIKGVNAFFSDLFFYFYFLNVFLISQLCYNTTIKLRDFQLKKKINKNSFQNVIKNIHFFSHFNCVAGNQSEVFIRNVLFLIFVWFHSEGINKQPEDTVLHESISKTPTQHIWKGHVFEISGWVMFHRVS